MAHNHRNFDDVFLVDAQAFFGPSRAGEVVRDG